MTRRVIWVVVAALGTMTMVGMWFLMHFERVPIKQYQPPQEQALRNPYLALERFMTRMGRPLTSTGDVRKLNVLVPGSVLILDRNRRALMTKARLDTLFKWVADGGYLIIVPEGITTPDPVLAYLHVRWDTRVCGVPPTCSASSVKADGLRRLAGVPPVPPGTVDIPGTDRSLTIEQPAGGLKPGDIIPQWRATGTTAGSWLLHYHYGMGNIALIVNLDQLISNQGLGKFDHAEFFWTLLEHYQPTGPIILMTHLPVPTLFDWLRSVAWAASTSALVLTALWLWQVIPRFAIAQSEPPPARRELREHLSAIARFVWRAQGFDRWLETARASFRELLRKRRPDIAALARGGQAEALAKLTSRPLGLVLSALGGAPKSDSEFTLMLRTLQSLKHDL